MSLLSVFLIILLTVISFFHFYVNANETNIARSQKALARSLDHSFLPSVDAVTSMACERFLVNAADQCIHV